MKDTMDKKHAAAVATLQAVHDANKQELDNTRSKYNSAVQEITDLKKERDDLEAEAQDLRTLLMEEKHEKTELESEIASLETVKEELLSQIKEEASTAATAESSLDPVTSSVFLPMQSGSAQMMSEI